MGKTRKNEVFKMSLADLLASAAKDPRERLIELGRIVLKAVNAPEEIGWGPIKFNILQRLTSEVYNLPPDRAEKILSQVKHLVSTWP